eukprot:Awhi_evm2s11226
MSITLFLILYQYVGKTERQYTSSYPTQSKLSQTHTITRGTLRTATTTNTNTLSYATSRNLSESYEEDLSRSTDTLRNGFSTSDSRIVSLSVNNSNNVNSNNENTEDDVNVTDLKDGLSTNDLRLRDSTNCTSITLDCIEADKGAPLPKNSTPVATKPNILRGKTYIRKRDEDFV